MLKPLLLALITLVCLPLSASGNQELPQVLQTGNTTLTLNGSGERSKFFLGLYQAGLYLPRAGQHDAARILDSDQPMAMRLVITSSLISAEKMQKATLEGFEKSTRGETAPLQTEISQFIAAFHEEIVEDDTFDLVYQPGDGVHVSKNGQEKAVITGGTPFKKALFGIWLSADPVQESLKQDLLGHQ